MFVGVAVAVKSCEPDRYSYVNRVDWTNKIDDKTLLETAAGSIYSRLTGGFLACR
jgi:hypothetical protein